MILAKLFFIFITCVWLCVNASWVGFNAYLFREDTANPRRWLMLGVSSAVTFSAATSHVVAYGLLFT